MLNKETYIYKNNLDLSSKLQKYWDYSNQREIENSEIAVENFQAEF